MTLKGIKSKPAEPFTYVQHRSHLLVRSVGPHDTGVYRCDSDLTKEASVQVYVVAPEDLMKSLHLHGAVENTDSSKINTFSENAFHDKSKSRVLTTSEDSSFISRAGGHKSKSFYDHPTKSHSQDYKNYKKNQTSENNIRSIWRMSPSAPSSAIYLSGYRNTSYLLIFITLIMTLFCSA